MPGWEADDYQAVAEFLARGVQQVADAGADFYICPDNTAHIVLERIAAELPIASVCVFQREFGEALGLDVASGERMRIATAPMPARLKEGAYAGFAITLASALIAHL